MWFNSSSFSEVQGHTLFWTSSQMIRVVVHVRTHTQTTIVPTWTLNFLPPKPPQHESVTAKVLQNTSHSLREFLPPSRIACLWPSLYSSGEKTSKPKQHSYTSFHGQFILLPLVKHPGDWSLGTSQFYLTYRNHAYNGSASVKPASAAMQRMDVLLLVVNSQQIPVYSFHWV